MTEPIQVLHGDCRDTLKTIPDGTVHCCVSSPPYWGLRSYLPKDHPDKHREIGQEKTPEQFVATMVEVFREVRRCLHESGTLFLNLGDTYSGGDRKFEPPQSLHNGEQRGTPDISVPNRNMGKHPTIKPKDLCGIPWRVALALQADGWYWRSCIVWHKRSCMPESVTDRPTNSWEPIFLLAKSQRYFYDAEAVKEVGEYPAGTKAAKASAQRAGENGVNSRPTEYAEYTGFRNQRNVWSLSPEPYPESHFATFPTEIPRRAILAGTSARGCCPKCLTPWERVLEAEAVTAMRESPSTQSKNKEQDPQFSQRRIRERTDRLRKQSDNHDNPFPAKKTVGWQPGCECDAGEPIPATVIDPFGGSGTTGAVALELGRNAILCELNHDYLPLIQKRTNVTKGLALA